MRQRKRLVIALSYANTLKDFTDFLVDLQNNLEVIIHGFDGINKLGGTPYFSRILRSGSWLAVLWALTRSTNATKEGK
jgi:hypothetical protein